MDSTKGLDNKAILCRRKIHKVLMVGLLCENMVVGKDRHSFFDAFRVDAFLPLLDECIVARVQEVCTARRDASRVSSLLMWLV